MSLIAHYISSYVVSSQIHINFKEKQSHAQGYTKIFMHKTLFSLHI